MKIFAAAILCLCAWSTACGPPQAQQQQAIPKPKPDAQTVRIDEPVCGPSRQIILKGGIYNYAEIFPVFPGGDKGFKDYITKNIRTIKGVQCRVVACVVIEKNGSVSNIKIIRSCTAKTDREAIRLLKHSPRWIPGKQKGKPVRVQYYLPILFS
ncbi:energy transducer TonB [Mucilaginibacter sp. PAMB04274]|uniref:energy transducer TonB n=1 Tax=Mucilaginibacter sp. PAMB04274 TaxID=3138568 RepID=UPI0031F6CA67